MQQSFGLALPGLVVGALVLVLVAIALILSIHALRRSERVARELAAVKAVILSLRLNAVATTREPAPQPSVLTDEPVGGSQPTRRVEPANPRPRDEPRAMTVATPDGQLVAPRSALAAPAQVPPASARLNPPPPPPQSLEPEPPARTFEAPPGLQDWAESGTGSPSSAAGAPEEETSVREALAPAPNAADKATKLADSLNHPNHVVRIAARAELRNGPASEDALLSALVDANDLVRLQAVRGLGDMGRVTAGRFLIDVLVRDPSPSVRAEAVTALASLLRRTIPPSAMADRR